MKIIRWILFLPAALLAGGIANSLGDLWVKYIYGPYIPWQPITDFERALFPIALAFGSFVFVAALVAPSHQRAVALVSAGIGAGLLAAVVGIGLTLAGSDEGATISWSGLVGTLVGAAAAFTLVFRLFITEAEPGPSRSTQSSSAVADLDQEHKARPLEEKAEDLVDACRMFIGVIAGKLRGDYRGFFAASPESFDRLIFFGTVACVNCSCIRLHFEVEKSRRTPLELIAQNELAAWHPDALEAYRDVHKFVSERVLNEPDRARRGELLFELAASWVVENAQAGRPAPHDAAVVGSLASQLANATAGYWRAS